MNKRLAHVRQQDGHTLLELTIAVALGLVVTLGALSAYRTQRQAYAHANDAARIHEAGMNSLMLIGEQIQMAGFVAADARSTLAGPAIFGCAAGRPIGTDGALTCEPLPSRSDGLAVRYQGDGVSTWAATNGQATDCLGQGVGVGSVEIVNRYHAKGREGTSESELYCAGSGKPGKPGTPQPLVEGVERLRLRYWTAGAAQAVEASALARDQWASVVAVDLCVLVRGAAFARRMRYVDCDGVQAFGADGRARQAFWRHIVLRNVLPAAS
ncbi:PilW family protein [Paraburkholderia sp. CNPSo 3076]|uniref:PilW family protein n=1 Tax=Paraburkholderia sp. CNPSo 3076 TaxID=2940936 RepID=UPI002250568D|nr:PilW family protein [Paraburkholderia sp. CNPSo 3076]MCX5542371.1 PilW family protein [Paraburkholderia sp. CNPSo 3076]